MAEHSSSLTTFRAFVMLLCVVLIPFAAVCGTSFPAVMKAIQSGRLPTLADFRGTNPAADKALSEAPPYLPGGASNAPAGRASAAQPVTPTLDSGGSGVIPINYEVPAPLANGSSGDQSTSFQQKRNSENSNSSAGERPGLSAVPPKASGPAAFDRSSVAGQPENAAPRLLADNSQSPAGQPLGGDARFKQIQQRLQQLGATYYLLETWGDQNDAYRFYCRMAIGGNQHVTKAFNSVAHEPLVAMTNVLQQVESWQKGGDSRMAQ